MRHFTCHLLTILLLLPSLAYGNEHRVNSSAPQENSSASNSITVVAPNGKIQITAPSGWTTATELNDRAELQAVGSGNQIFLIALSDEKNNYVNMTLDLHSRETLGTLQKSLKSFSTSGSIPLTVNGQPAVQYEVRGLIMGLEVVYLHTTVETPDNFHQIVAWVLAKDFDTKKSAIQDVIQSFKETGR